MTSVSGNRIGDENIVISTSVRGRMSGSACILAVISHKMIPYANTSTCRERTNSLSASDNTAGEDKTK